MAKKKRRRRAPEETAPLAGRKRKTFRRLFVLLLLLLGGALAAAPAILSRTALRDTVLGLALPAEGWRIETSGAVLGWTGQQSLSGVSITAPDGKRLLTAESITCPRSLWQLAINWTDMGKVQIQQPTVFLVTRPDGSNVEDLLAQLVQGESPASEMQLALIVEVVEGTLHGLDTTTQQQWSLSEANVVASLQGDVTGSANIITAQGGAPSHVKFRLQPDNAGGQQLDLLAEKLPLQLIQPWLSRAIPGAQIAGTITIDAPQVRWTTDPQRGLQVQTSGRIEAQEFTFTADALQGDRIYAKQINAPWQLSVTGDQISVEQLSVDAGWSKLTAHGSFLLSELTTWSLDNLPQSQTTLVGNVDLDRLAAMLPQTLQFREEVRIDSGQLIFRAGSKPSASSFAWTATATVQDVGGTNRGQPIRLQPMEAKVVFARGPQGPQMEQLTLTAPFAEAQFATNRDEIVGNFQLDLDQFSQELGQFVDFGTWQLAGKAQLSAKLRLAASTLHVNKSEGTIENLRVQSDSMLIDEPRVQFAGSFDWDPKTGTLVSPEFQLTGSTLAFRSRDVTLGPAADGSTMATGQMAFNADLERLASALGWVGDGESIWPRGKTQGQLKLASRNGLLQADFSASAEQLQLLQNQGGGRPELLWSEPELQVSGKAVYEMAADRARFDQLQVNGQTLQLSGQARIEQVSSTQQLRVIGQVQYDAQVLSQLLMVTLGPDVQLQGDRIVRFQVAGPLSVPSGADAPYDWAQHWQVSADAAWSSASLYGLAMSAGKLQGKLQNGQLQIAPLDLAIGEGKLTARPQVSLAAGSERLFLPSGPLLTNVQISPQVSETMLKYVAPIVAGATRTTGEFSVTLSDLQVPLIQPEQAQVAGQLAVHHLRVTPGPMLKELETVIRQLKNLSKGKQFLAAATSSRQSSALSVKNRNIDFQVVQGRVYHRNLEFEIDDVPVTSQGSVGFDQTLALVFEITLQEKWLGSSLRSLAGRTVQIPLQGTFQNPKLDRRAITDLTSRFVQEAATEVIGDEVNRQLEKLFRGR